MDNDLILSQFEQIEQRVDKLLNVCKSLEDDNVELKTQVELLEEELRKKEEAENRYQEERGLVRSRIDGLLNKLNNLSENQGL
ncbi:MAG: cell division protein ZapB [Deltaproteobacteria bacterium]|nr:cell division protein ZapB [Deltaproteobacteria bacterium]